MITTLGDTGLRVTRIGLGLAALGRPGYINLGHARRPARRHGRARTGAPARTPCSTPPTPAGVRYFDAARSYGEAEAFLASWLDARGLEPRRGHGRLEVGLHVHRGLADRRRAARGQGPLARARSAASWPRRRALLGAHLGLYQIHSATLESGVLDDRAVLRRAARGCARAAWPIGLTADRPAPGRDDRAGARGRAASTPCRRRGTCSSARPAPALAAAHAAGLGVIIKEALANGRLTDRGDAAPVAGGRRARGEATPDALALACVLAQPWVDVVLSGAATVEQLRSNLGALDPSRSIPGPSTTSSRTRKRIGSYAASYPGTNGHRDLV